MNKKIRFLALVLTIVMLVCALPLAVFAKNGEPVSDLTNALDTDVLDEMAAKAENPLYATPTTAEIAAALGISDNTATGTNGAFVSEGHYGINANGSKGFIGEHAYLAGSGGPNYQPQTYVYGEDYVEFRDVPSDGNISINYTNGATFQKDGDAFKTKYIYFSMNMMRGEAMTNGLSFARIRLVKKDGTGNLENHFVYYKNGTLSAGSTVSGKTTAVGTAVPFSTSVYTNIAFVYDTVNDTFTSYMNGVKVAEVKNKFGGAELFKRINDINWWAGNTAYNGRVYTLKNIRTLFINDAATLATCVAEDTALATGVYKVGNDYYLYENNFPVLGATKIIDGYEIVTEANTGKIIKCKPTDYQSIYYERWNASEYKANGVTLSKDTVGTGISGTYASDVKGYSCTETTDEDGNVTYTISKDKVVILSKRSVGTVVDNGNGFELTGKLTVPSVPYYKDLPADKQEIKDSKGNVTGYTSKTAPDANANSGYKDLSYYTGLEDTTVGANGFITDYANLNFRFKAGENPIATTMFRFRCYINEAKTYTNSKGENKSAVIDNDIGKIVITDGAPHFVISDVDCGILRTDVYTDITMRTYIKDKVLVYDLYVNGVCIEEGIKLVTGSTNLGANEVESYMISSVGTYSGTKTFWDEPLVTWGKVQVYYGDKVNNNENPYTGNILADNGKVYTYENGIATAVTSDYTESGMVDLVGYNATLAENIGLNFYAKLPANAAKAVVTVAGEENEIDVAALTPDTEGKCKITANVSSINVAEEVKLAFYDADGEAIAIITERGACDDYFSTSVKAYLNTLIKDEAIYGADNAAAAKALLAYAAFAENYFKKNTEFTTAYSAADVEAVKAVNAADIAAKGTVIGTSAKLGTANLVLNNTTKIRINLTAEAVFESDYDNVVYVASGDNFYVEIRGIDAKNLDNVYTFTIDGTDVKINTLGIAAVVAADTTPEKANFANLMKALYLYSEACEKLA